MKFEDFANRFEFKRKTTAGYMVVCPAHDDSPKSPSLSIGKAKDGGVVLKCFANCATESVVAKLGLGMRDLFASEQPRQFSPPKVAAPTTPATPATPAEKPVIEKIYPYQNVAGTEAYQVVRLKPKSFRQRHLVNGKWVWNMDGVVRVLYRLPEIMTSQQVIVCEGEKDADNLCELGFQATCNVGGAGKWLDAYTDCLRGKDVVLCGDNDEAGKKHMELVFDSIAGVAKTVKVLRLPSGIKDASDLIAAQKSKEEAKTLFSNLVNDSYPHIKGVKLPIYTMGELEDSYKQFVAQYAKCSFSLGSWLPSFNKIRPLVPGELVFIIGDTGVGKTGIAQSIAKAALPLPTLMFELELPKELMFERFASMATGFSCEDVEAGYRCAPDDSLAGAIDNKLKNLFICPESRLSVEQIESYILQSELKIGERPKVVIVDYIQLLSAKGQSRREKISDIAEGLKVVAKTTGTVIIVTSQVSRPPKMEEGEEWQPTLHSAKESGSIEASCGLLIGAWRGGDGSLKLRVLKSTKGGAGLTVECNFNGAKMMITERSQFSDSDVPIL